MNAESVAAAPCLARGNTLGRGLRYPIHDVAQVSVAPRIPQGCLSARLPQLVQRGTHTLSDPLGDTQAPGGGMDAYCLGIPGPFPRPAQRPGSAPAPGE